MKIALVVNALVLERAGCREAIGQVEKSTLISSCEILVTRHAGHAVELAQEASRDSDVIVAVGGDGTVSEVANGCMPAGAADGARVLPILGVLGFGTANDFIKSLQLRGSAAELLELIRHQSHRPIDLGRVRYAAADGSRVERYFINIADVGVGADVVRRVKRGRATLGANLTFLRSAALALLRYRRPPLRVSIDDEDPVESRLLAVIAANGRFFGSGLCVAPAAQLDDGRLSLVLVGNIRVTDFIRHLGELKHQAEIADPRVNYRTASRLTVDSAAAPCPLEADGEFLGYTPATFEILPGRLRVFC